MTGASRRLYRPWGSDGVHAALGCLMTLPASGSLLFQVQGLAPYFSMVCRTPGRAHGCRMVHANAHEFRSLLQRQRLPLHRRCGLVLSVVLICWAPRACHHPCAPVGGPQFWRPLPRLWHRHPRCRSLPSSASFWGGGRSAAGHYDGGLDECLRLVQANAPSTLSNYLGRWKQWQSFCDVQSVDSWSPSVSFMCDFLITHCKGQLGSAVGWLKALRFVSFRLEVPTLKSVLQSEAVRAFGKSVNIVQRRETAPFPLSFVIWLERQVLDASQTAAQRIRCGFLLVCVFASLRWSDAQWSPPSFLHCERQASLGTAVRTKTTSRSMPWGAWAPGFLARPQTAAGWGQIWLCLVQEAVVRTTSAKPGFRPDFLVADLGPDEREPVFTAPLNRSAGVVLIRQLLTRCYEHVEPAQRPDLSLIGVHSAKVTLLSIAKQLLLDESLRREQGHHRAPAGQA